MVFLNKKKKWIYEKKCTSYCFTAKFKHEKHKKNKPRWRFSTATFFFVKLRWEKKKMLFFLPNGFAFRSSVWSKSTFAIFS